ncbi:MAG TPA: hypothetical protein VI893_10700 [Thermoplasmata archaeon]|nr:hypothetical protein [Thermoplasmata archaeon]
MTQQWLIPIKAVWYFANKIRAESATPEQAAGELELLGYSIGLCSGLEQGRLVLDDFLREHADDRSSNEWQNRGFSKVKFLQLKDGGLAVVLKQYLKEEFTYHPVYKGMLEGYARAVLGARFTARVEKEAGGQLLYLLDQESTPPKDPRATEKVKFPLPEGKFRIVREESHASAYKIFANYVNSGTSGLVVSHLHPSIVTKESGTDAFEIIYLSEELDGKERAGVSPKRMKFEVSQRINKFLAEREIEGKPGILFVNAITNLRRYNSFDDLYEFVDKTAKKLARARSFGLIYLKPGSLSSEEAQQISDVIGG